jgi:hypothetical protein
MSYEFFMDIEDDIDVLVGKTIFSLLDITATLPSIRSGSKFAYRVCFFLRMCRVWHGVETKHGYILQHRQMRMQHQWRMQML